MRGVRLGGILPKISHETKMNCFQTAMTWAPNRTAHRALHQAMNLDWMRVQGCCCAAPSLHSLRDNCTQRTSAQDALHVTLHDTQ